MDHKRINKLIKKISSLNSSIEEDGEFSSMEKDHMLNYIKKLYEEVNGEIPDDFEEATAVVAAAPIVTKTANSKAIKVEEVEEVDEVVEEIVEEEEEVVVENKTDEVAIDASILALFEEEGGSDLSDKLAARPIKNLTKAMGLNEKIFTVTELFGGNQSEFDNMMLALDSLGSFDEAKNVLIQSVADKYEWASDKKVKKATGFIKLVRRRFN